MPLVLGLDIGGANLKAAHAARQARTRAFALWKQPAQLAAELVRLRMEMPDHDTLAITMTGELCDCFASKRDGVRAILGSVTAAAGGVPVRVWCTQGRFMDVQEALDNPLPVGSANWLALAHYVAREFPSERVLLIDAGSTTTDIIYLDRGQPVPRGLTDSARLASGELVYTGAVRTPVCAVLGLEVAAEFFATMRDAYILTGLLPEDSADCDTADGRPATRIDAHSRMARMRCADAESMTLTEAQGLAERALQTQWHAVARAIERVIHGRSSIERIVLSGSGEILARSACTLLPPVTAIPVTSLRERLGPALSTAACAYAVAILAASEDNGHERGMDGREGRRQSL